MASNTFLLLILDGFGYRPETQYNAIAKAHTPNWDWLWQNCPHLLISGSGTDVGLPNGQMGNSEVGHMNIGAGRVVYQDLSLIDHAIETGEFFQNPVLLEALNQVGSSRRLHVMGLLSPGGVHSHENHFHALIDLLAQRQIHHVSVHAFLDGRDTPPKSALPSLLRLQAKLENSRVGQIATLTGRYYAMDRDQRFERTQAAYTLLTEPNDTRYQFATVDQALEAAYDRGETDEFVQPTVIGKPQAIQDGDVVIFMNFRADRARQLSYAFLQDSFNGFHRNRRPQLARLVSLTEYATDLATQVAFPAQTIKNSLGEYLAHLGYSQLRMAETEKYAHVTFFLNGGVETAYPGEDRILVPSPKVATYDLKPEMSAFELTEKLVAAIQSEKYRLIVCNYANSDMVGHTGDFDAAVQAIEALDQCIGKIIETLKNHRGEMILTADHGNAECMYDENTQQAHTAHTSELVPCVYFGPQNVAPKIQGRLSDIAPSILQLMGLTIPTEMTGEPLFLDEST